MKLLLENWHKYLNEKKDTNKVAKVVIIDLKNNKILLLKRTKDMPKYANYWDLPGGHVHEGEDIEDGGVRETKEETNLSIENLKLIKKDKNVHFYTTSNFSGTIKLDPDEHTNYKWINIEDLKKYKLPPGGKESVRKAYK